MEQKYPFDSWKAPQKTEKSFLTGLKVNNSLYPHSHTDQLTEFIPAHGKRVNWYMCGPTVYDSAHLGHARTYLTFDMIRRVLEDYFGYDVFLVMNITDIDDKIIIRSRENNEEFGSFARNWEKDFFEDMKLLRVELPNVVTRVSEYVPQIVDYIQTIIKNEFAYEANGSVYFDVEEYQKKHTYGKLAPWSINDEQLLKEGEGALGAQNEKKNKQDFALWKASKPGEPKWPSPWGEGRPGWHIECSAMANEILGQTFDLHSGGYDLKFPHHENEIAQAEAHDQHQQWTNYFIHSGRLDIDGLKMSKSLKNFIKIKNLVKEYGYKEIRLLFLLHKYDEVMDFHDKPNEDAESTPQTEPSKQNEPTKQIETSKQTATKKTTSSMTEPVEKVKRFKEFFRNVKAVLRQNPVEKEQRWSKVDTELQQKFAEHQELIHQHFIKNFFTPGVIKELDKLISAVNTYLQSPGVKLPLVTAITNYIKKIFKVLGLDFDETTETGTLKNEEETVAPYLDVVSKFRDQVRDAARKKEFGVILQSCDDIRDVWLPQLGVRLEDKANGPSIWKYDDKEVLLKEMQDKAAAKKFKEEEKKEKEDEKKRKDEELLEKSKIHPNQMYLKETDKYSKFDEKGIPTHDHEGKEISKGLLKKLVKDYEKQEKLHSDWLVTQKK